MSGAARRPFDDRDDRGDLANPQPSQFRSERFDLARGRPSPLWPRRIWTIPTDGYGNCKDYALAKRKDLAAAGFPILALRMAIVITPREKRHAVLTVATDKGDFVLDNLENDIVAWKRHRLHLDRTAGRHQPDELGISPTAHYGRREYRFAGWQDNSA